MSRRALDDPDDDDDDLSGDTAELDVWTGDDDLPTVACPKCGWHIPEDAPRCPYCETYVTDEDAPVQPKPWWIVLGTLACLYIIYRWIAG